MLKVLVLEMREGAGVPRGWCAGGGLTVEAGYKGGPIWAVKIKQALRAGARPLPRYRAGA